MKDFEGEKFWCKVAVAVDKSNDVKKEVEKIIWDTIKKKLKLPQESLKTGLEKMIGLMKENIPEPDLSSIVSLREFPKFYLERTVYEQIKVRCNEALIDFKREIGLLPF